MTVIFGKTYVASRLAETDFGENKYGQRYIMQKEGT